MGYEHVSVGYRTVWKKNDQFYWVGSTKEMRDFMEQFDHGMLVLPALFIVEPRTGDPVSRD